MSTLEIVKQTFTDLASFVVTGLPIGTSVTDLGGTSWTLTYSVAAVDHTTVEAVKDVPSLRWIKVANSSLLPGYSSVLGSAATSNVLSGLNGDADGDYLIDMKFIAAVGSNNLSIQVNGGTLNLDWLCSNDLVGGAVRTDWVFCQVGVSPLVWSANDIIELQARLRARSGQVRIMTGLAWVTLGGSKTGLNLKGRYNDTSTNITSISQVSSQTNGLAAGSYIRLIKLANNIPLV
jgi:hypothetical protein